MKRLTILLCAVAVLAGGGLLGGFVGYDLADSDRPRVLCTETTDENGWTRLRCHSVPPDGPIHFGSTPEEIEQQWADAQQEQMTFYCPTVDATTDSSPGGLTCVTSVEVKSGTTLRIMARPRNQVKFADWIEKGVKR